MNTDQKVLATNRHQIARMIRENRPVSLKTAVTRAPRVRRGVSGYLYNIMGGFTNGRASFASLLRF